MRCITCGVKISKPQRLCDACREKLLTPSETPHPLHAAITHLIETHAYDEALQQCQSLLDAEPTSDFAFEAIGDIAIAQGRLRDAIQAYREAVPFATSKNTTLRRKLDQALDSMLGMHQQESEEAVVQEETPVAVAVMEPPVEEAPAAGHTEQRSAETAAVSFPGQPEIRKPAEEEGETPPSSFLGPWLTPKRATAVCIFAVLVIILALLMLFHPWTPRYIAPPSVAPIPLEGDAGGVSIGIT